MYADVGIKTDKRTLLEYLLKPLDKLLRMVLRQHPEIRAGEAQLNVSSERLLLPSFDLELRQRLLFEIDPIPQIDACQSAKFQFKTINLTRMFHKPASLPFF